MALVETCVDILKFKVTTPLTLCIRLQLSPDCIQIQRNNDGRPSGEAVVNFQSRAEAERAVAEKNRHNMGTRYIELFMS